MPKILLVDDNADIRFLVGRLLEERFAAEVIEACSGEESSHLILSTKIDLIVSDLHMPNGSGIWLYEFLCTQSLAIPFILFTSFLREDLPLPDGNLKAIVSKAESPILFRVIEELKLFSGRGVVGRG